MKTRYEVKQTALGRVQMKFPNTEAKENSKKTKQKNPEQKTLKA